MYRSYDGKKEYPNIHHYYNRQMKQYVYHYGRKFLMLKLHLQKSHLPGFVVTYNLNFHNFRCKGLEIHHCYNLRKLIREQRHYNLYWQQRLHLQKNHLLNSGKVYWDCYRKFPDKCLLSHPNRNQNMLQPSMIHFQFVMQ